MRLVGVGRSLGVRVCGSLGDVGMGAAAGVGVGTAGMRPSRPGPSAGDGGAVAHAFQRLLDPVEKRNRCDSDDVHGDSRNTYVFNRFFAKFSISSSIIIGDIWLCVSVCE